MTEELIERLDMTPTGGLKLPRWQYELRAAAACLEVDKPLTPEFRKAPSDMLGRHQSAILALSARVAELEGAIASARNDLSEGLTAALPEDERAWLLRRRFQNALAALDATLTKEAVVDG